MMWFPRLLLWWCAISVAGVAVILTCQTVATKVRGWREARSNAAMWAELDTYELVKP